MNSQRIYYQHQKGITIDENNFIQCLFNQDNRDDAISDLANDMKNDRHLLITIDSYNQIESFLRSRGACIEAIELLKDARTEFQNSKPHKRLQ